MAVTLTSNWAKVIDRAQRLIAASSTFQTLTDSDDSTEALTRVHKGAAVDEQNDAGLETHPWPRAIVRQGPALSLTKMGTSYWSRRGSVFVTLEAEVPHGEGVTDDDYASEEEWFLNQVGGLLDDIATNAGIGTSVTGETHLAVVNAELESGPWQAPPSEQPMRTLDVDRGTRWWADLILEYQA